MLDLKIARCESEKDFETDSEDEFETVEEIQENILNSETDLEKAFKKLRKGNHLRREEETALIAFTDKFITCTLNPAMAANMIDAKTCLSEGLQIVKIVKETQTHYHIKTCKKIHPNADSGCQSFPCGGQC